MQTSSQEAMKFLCINASETVVSQTIVHTRNKESFKLKSISFITFRGIKFWCKHDENQFKSPKTSL